MQFLAILMPLAGIVAAVGFIWLLVVAFRNSALWGVLVFLFSPIGAIVFAIRYWNEAKRPFLVYLGSCVSLVLLAFSMVLFVGNEMVKTVAGMEPAAVTTDFEIPAFQPAAEGEVATAAAQDLSVPVGDAAAGSEAQQAALAIAERMKPVEEAPTPKLQPEALPEPEPEPGQLTLANRDDIPLSRLGDHVGERVRVVTRNGGEFIGHYAGGRDGRLEFEKHVRSGVLVVYFERSELVSVHRHRSRP
jgi:hypothetical protein